MRTLSVKHSGGAGDIIYSIPTLLSLVAQRRIEHVTYYLNLNQRVKYGGWHPLGSLLLSPAFVEQLTPLLMAQPCIQSVQIYSGEPIDVDFDTFRYNGINTSTYCIPRWYFLSFPGATWDLARPWLNVAPDYRFKDAAVVSRNPRLPSKFINYGFMDRYADDIVFVGMRREFDEFVRECPRCTRFYEAPNFLELAAVLAGCRFFAGNQGFIYTLAEALKIPRLLETNKKAANNIPFGGECYDALFQDGFEYWFSDLIQRPRAAANPV